MYEVSPACARASGVPVFTDGISILTGDTYKISKLFKCNCENAFPGLTEEGGGGGAHMKVSWTKLPGESFT